MVASDSWASEKQNEIRVSRYKAHVQLVGVINNLLKVDNEVIFTLMQYENALYIADLKCTYIL